MENQLDSIRPTVEQIEAHQQLNTQLSLYYSDISSYPPPIPSNVREILPEINVEATCLCLHHLDLLTFNQNNFDLSSRLNLIYPDLKIIKIKGIYCQPELIATILSACHSLTEVHIEACYYCPSNERLENILEESLWPLRANEIPRVTAPGVPLNPLANPPSIFVDGSLRPFFESNYLLENLPTNLEELYVCGRGAYYIWPNLSNLFNPLANYRVLTTLSLKHFQIQSILRNTSPPQIFTLSLPGNIKTLELIECPIGCLIRWDLSDTSIESVTITNEFFFPEEPPDPYRLVPMWPSTLNKLALTALHLTAEIGEQGLFRQAKEVTISRCRLGPNALEHLDSNLQKLEIRGSNGAPTLGRVQLLCPEARIVGISGEQNAEERLIERISSQVIGQRLAVHKIAQILSQLPSRQATRPRGVLFFTGPSGVGKTELAKVAASTTERAFLRLDMSEYQEQETIQNLIGGGSGLVGYTEGGILTNWGLEHSESGSIILLDEIEKAHRRVIQLFLGVFDAGRLRDSRGREVDFSNSIFIMTSNLGVNQFINQTQLPENLSTLIADIAKEQLSQQIGPEFVGRINSTIGFDLLSEQEVGDILKLKLNQEVGSVFREEGYHIEYQENVWSHYLNDLDRHIFMGARPLVNELILELRALLGRVHNDINRGERIMISRNNENHQLTARLIR